MGAGPNEILHQHFGLGKDGMEEAVASCNLPNTCKNDLVSNQEAISLEESLSTLDGKA
jgi:hypothetical protein